MAAALYVNDDPNSFVGLLAIMGWPRCLARRPRDLRLLVAAQSTTEDVLERRVTMTSVGDSCLARRGFRRVGLQRLGPRRLDALRVIGVPVGCCAMSAITKTPLAGGIVSR